MTQIIAENNKFDKNTAATLGNFCYFSQLREEGNPLLICGANKFC